MNDEHTGIRPEQPATEVMIVYIVLDMFNKVKVVFDNDDKAWAYVQEHNSGIFPEGCYIVKKKVM